MYPHTLGMNYLECVDKKEYCESTLAAVTLFCKKGLAAVNLIITTATKPTEG